MGPKKIKISPRNLMLENRKNTSWRGNLVSLKEISNSSKDAYRVRPDKDGSVVGGTTS